MTHPMYSLLVCFTFLLTVLPASTITLTTSAQPFTGGTRHTGLSGATVALPDDFWASSNPASLRTPDRWAARLFTSQRYGLRELRLGAARLIFPAGATAIGLKAQSFGSSLYRKTQVEAGLSRALAFGASRFVQAGLSISMASTTVSDFGSSTAWQYRVGLILELWPSIYWGASFSQPFRLTSTQNDQVYLRSGISADVGGASWLLFSAEKTLDLPLSIQAGMEHQITHRVRIQTGIGTQPSRYSFGIGIYVPGISLGIATERHYALGWTPALSIGHGRTVN